MNKFVVQMPRNHSKKQSIPKVQRETKKRNQMCLDLGQKNLKKRVSCGKCGMVYVLGDCSDEADHKKFCLQASKGILLPSLQGHTILRSIDDDNVIIHLNNNIHKQVTIKLFDVVNDDLGSPPGFVDDAFAIYLYVKRRVVVGMVAVDKLTSAQDCCRISEAAIDASTPVCVISPPASSSFSAATSEQGSTSVEISPSSDDSNVVHSTCYRLGIRQIWVRKDVRRQKVAHCLVECARKQLFMAFGNTIIAPIDIAFSQPTVDGLSFARSYTGIKNVWAY